MNQNTQVLRGVSVWNKQSWSDKTSQCSVDRASTRAQKHRRRRTTLRHLRQLLLCRCKQTPPSTSFVSNSCRGARRRASRVCCDVTTTLSSVALSRFEHSLIFCWRLRAIFWNVLYPTYTGCEGTLWYLAKYYLLNRASQRSEWKGHGFDNREDPKYQTVLIKNTVGTTHAVRDTAGI